MTAITFLLACVAVAAVGLAWRSGCNAVERLRELQGAADARVAARADEQQQEILFGDEEAGTYGMFPPPPPFLNPPSHHWE